MPEASSSKVRTMRDFEEGTHVFIVRLWREPRELEGAMPVLRGAIEHVPSGNRRYINDLRQIVEFLSSYMETPDFKLTKRERLKRWLTDRGLFRKD